MIIRRPGRRKKERVEKERIKKERKGTDRRKEGRRKTEERRGPERRENPVERFSDVFAVEGEKEPTFQDPKPEFSHFMVSQSTGDVTYYYFDRREPEKAFDRRQEDSDRREKGSDRRQPERKKIKGKGPKYKLRRKR
jgi:hypothetical protein